MSAWTATEVSTLKRLWSEGIPTAKIGEALGRSKNSVIGQAHRMSLKPRNAGHQGGKAMTKTKPKKKARKGWDPKAPPEAKLPPMPIPKLEVTSAPVPLLQLTREHCKAIVEGRDPQYGLAMFCGEPVVRGESWCQRHADLYLNPQYRRNP